nr:MAG TPA: hypothetical protein [Caudoviricetes sp.]
MTFVKTHMSSFCPQESAHILRIQAYFSLKPCLDHFVDTRIWHPPRSE